MEESNELLWVETARNIFNHLTNQGLHNQSNISISEPYFFNISRLYFAVKYTFLKRTGIQAVIDAIFKAT